MSAKFGPGGNSDSFRALGYRSTLDAPEFVKRMGIDAYEYEAGNGLAASGEMLLEIGKRATAAGVAMSYHTPYFISLSGVVEETRLKSIEYIRQSIEAARLLGANIIVVHSGSCAKISRDEAMRLAEDTLARTLAEVDTHGIKIGLETMGKKNQLGTLDEVIELCRLSEGLAPVIDFGHLNARDCGNVFASADDYLRVFDKIERLLSPETANSLHCHFSKIEWTEKGERRHLTFDDTTFGPAFEPFALALAKSGYSPTVICESAGTQAEDARLMKEKYLEYLNDQAK